ncbi:MAG: CoA-binding protein [Deltaproteobacteria bacterium]
MREFFYPSSIAVFGVANSPRNLAKNIIMNCEEMGFEGDIFPVGREGGSLNGRSILVDGDALPTGIDLAVILVPASAVAQVLDACGRKGIRHAVISTGGYREFNDQDNEAERQLLAVARQHGIRFIGPNCIGVICTQSGLCTPFSPMEPKHCKKGRISIIAQSGGVATQTTNHFSDEYVGFSKIISAGNKLDLDEVGLIEYLMEDDDTDQIHLYLESIENGRELLRVVEKCSKPIVVFKANVSRTSARVAESHTAALANNDAVLDGFLKQAGIVRVRDIHDMTVCAKALRLPPLRGDRLVVISLSGGFAVILGDACEAHGFECPALPRELLDEIEGFRRAGVIRMSNPMDFGDVHDLEALFFALERCLSLEYIDGLVLCLNYTPRFERMFGNTGNLREPFLTALKQLCMEKRKPVSVSFFSEKMYIDAFKRMDLFPVFTTPEESVRALRMLRDYWRNRLAADNSGDD